MPSLPSVNLPGTIPLLTRQQYQSCHIRVADTAQTLAAICVDSAYYSFFKIASAASASKVVARLLQRGDVPLLTQTPKGFAIWVQELNAQPLQRQSKPSQETPIDPALWRILTSEKQYRHCQIHVPDLDENLDAICFENHYYSLFRAIEDLQQTLPLINKLSDRGDKIVIVKTLEGYSLWVLEPDAQAIE